MEGPDLTPPSRAEPTGVDHLLDHASVAACAILPGAELSRATRIAPHGHAPSGTLAFPQAHGAGAPQEVLPELGMSEGLPVGPATTRPSPAAPSATAPGW